MRLKQLLERAGTWPEHAQEQLADIATEIETGLADEYQPTAEELRAIDEADTGGLASEAEVAAAFRSFRRA